MTTHLLVIAWCFPPFSGGGVYRPLHFVRHLSARGYRITVLTGLHSSADPQDPSLLKRVPDSVRVLRVPHHDPFRWWESLNRWGRAAFGPPGEAASKGKGSATRRPGSWKDRWSEALQLPDRYRSWILPATLRAASALSSDPPGVLFSTAPPHSMHLVALHLRSLWQRPLVIDFRDPWVDNPFRVRPEAWVERWHRRTERAVVLEADQVILNTPALERKFRARYPECAHFRTITNGFDVDAVAEESRVPRTGGARLSIVHVGHLYGLRSGRHLLEGLARLRARNASAYAALHVKLVGRIEDSAGFAAGIERLGVSDGVELEGPCTHAQALRRQREADVLLVLGVEGEGPEIQVPSKLYEYFAAGRPVLTLSRKGGAIEDVLKGADYPHERAEPDDPDEIAAVFERWAMRHLRGESFAVERGKVDRFRYDRLTDQLEECLWDAALRLAPCG